jgi:hypothetical protein
VCTPSATANSGCTDGRHRGGSGEFSDSHADGDKPDCGGVATDTTDTADTTDGPDQASSDPAPDDETTAEKAARLAPGGLRGIVEDYLRDHPTDELGPAKIGRELGRSSGAVANALDRLVKDGYALMVYPRPPHARAVLVGKQPQRGLGLSVPSARDRAHRASRGL